MDTKGMRSVHLLFTAPADAVTPEALSAFLSQQLAEGVSLEYKREVNDKCLATIAALANTYGGLLLIGVEDDKTACGVPITERARLINLCHGRLEPPFTPEVIPVEVGPG